MGRLTIGDAQLIETHRAKAGVIHIGRERGGAVGGAYGAADKAPAPILRFSKLRRFARKSRAGSVEIGDMGFEPVVSLRDAGGGKGVSLHHISARQKIGEMNVADGVGLGEIEKIVIAPQVALGVLETHAAKARFIQPQVLNHRAHGAVEYENALARGLRQRRAHRLAVGHFEVRHHAALMVSCGRNPSKWQIA